MPEGPRCFRWWIVRPSGPAARNLPLFCKALDTMSVVKEEREVSNGCALLMRRLTPRARWHRFIKEPGYAKQGKKLPGVLI